jgi:16S rRNA (guanine527-N7)-methyltransferase
MRKMGAELPRLEREEFDTRLQRCSPVPVSDQLRAGLYLHYQELCRWNRSLSLVGPSRGDEIVERHYGESLAAVPLIGEGDKKAVDLGSGAGFPGLVLAMARPDLDVFLVEARERKWAFLTTVCRKTALSAICLNARVGATLPDLVPETIDVVTSRALKLTPEVLAAVAERLSPAGQLLLWTGKTDPRMPTELTIVASRQLPGAATRRLLEVRRRPAPAGRHRRRERMGPG